MVGICADKHGLVSIFSIGLVLKVTSRKFTVFVLTWHVILKPNCWKQSINCFLALSAVLGPIFRNAASPLSSVFNIRGV